MAVELNTQRKGVSISWKPGKYEGLVKIVSTGKNGDVHTKAQIDNTGEAGLFFPLEFKGNVEVEVLDSFDNVIDSGTIKV